MWAGVQPVPDLIRGTGSRQNKVTEPLLDPSTGEAYLALLQTDFAHPSKSPWRVVLPRKSRMFHDPVNGLFALTTRKD
jgi:hypothetical protein